MRKLTVASSIVSLRTDEPLTPAMTAVAWELVSALDKHRVPATVDNSFWLTVPAADLRSRGRPTDNFWLRRTLRRLTGVYFEGEYRGDPWGSVLLSQWELIKGGSVARLLIPPAAIHALRAAETFAKLEADAVHRLPLHARRLYAILADKKRLGRPHWTFELDELRTLLGVDEKKSYRRFNTFNERVLAPSVAAINKYGSVEVSAKPQRLGRSVHAVRFDWEWKDPHAAEETVAENARSEVARDKQQADASAPPLTRQAAWERIQAAFRTDHGEAAWKSWCAGLRIGEGAAGAVTIAAPSAFRCDRIQADYGEWLAAAWEAEEAGVVVEFGVVDEDADLEHARKWWLEAPQKLRINALLNLGIQRPTVADLADDTAQIQDISDLLIYFDDPVDVRSQRWAERRRARKAPPAPAPAAEDIDTN